MGLIGPQRDRGRGVEGTEGEQRPGTRTLQKQKKGKETGGDAGGQKLDKPERKKRKKLNMRLRL